MAKPFAGVAGFGVTFRTMFKKVVTEQYPEERKQTAPRFHGRHVLNRHPDGLEKCVGCELCAWACPADAIFVEGADNTEDERFSPGERYGRIYQINYLRCIFCGLCIEACPTRALTMSNEFELADTSRSKLIYEKQDLLAPLLPGMAQPPHPMVPGTDAEDYYHGKVTQAVPEQLAAIKDRADADERVLQGVGAASTGEPIGSEADVAAGREPVPTPEQAERSYVQDSWKEEGDHS